MTYEKNYELIGYDETGKEVVGRHSVPSSHWYQVGDAIEEQSGAQWRVVRVRNTSTESLRLVEVRRI